MKLWKIEECNSNSKWRLREDDGEELGDKNGIGTASPITSNHSITFTTNSTNHSNTTFTSVITVN